MKLKYIELYGFKSFAEKTKLTFNKDISAIVGPNGSGKSNIADAIKWVLGEQSAKSLRGSNMHDVIFSGTETKKQMNMAQVSLILDNSDKSLPIAFDEVNVTRRVYRTGESEYLINKATVRLKDIKELFLDTGIGKDGYSMIGQGRIDEILNGKNDERRYIFEEACGISKNKYKKSEAERKLVKNEENLNYLTSEIKIKQQETDLLEKQASNAKEGMKLTSRLEILELNILDRAISKASTDLDKDKAQLEYLEKTLDDETKYLSILQEKILPIEEKIDFSSNKLEQLREDSFNSDKNLQKIDSDIEIKSQKSNFYKIDIERLEKDIENKTLRIENFSNLLSQKKIESEKLDKKKTKISENISKIKSEIKDSQEKLYNSNQNFDSIKNIIEESKDKLSKLQIDRSTKEKLDNSNEKLKDNYQNEILALEKIINEKNTRIEQLNSNIQEIDKKLTENGEKILTEIENRESHQNILANLQNNISALKSDYLKLESKRDILEKQYKSYDGYYKSVQNLLMIADKNKDISSRIVGVLADLISIDDKYKVALDVALGTSLQNIVVRDDLDGKYLIDFIKRQNIGRITFLPISKIKSQKAETYHKLAINTLNNLVEFDNNIEDIVNHFLARTVIVNDMQDALVVSRELKGYRVITLDGEVINSWGSMVGGNTFKKESNSLLNRKKELDDLFSNIESISNSLNSVNKEFEKESKLLSNVIHTLQNLDQQNSDLMGDKRLVTSNLNETIIEKTFTEKRREEFTTLISNINEELKELDFSEILVLENLIESSELDLENISVERNNLTNSIQDKEKELVKLESEEEVVKRDLSIINTEIENLMIDIEDTNLNLNNDNQNLDLTKKELSSIEENIKSLISQKEYLKQLSSDKSDLLKSLEKELFTMKEEIKNDKKTLEDLRLSISESEKDKYKIELKIENSQERVNSLITDYVDTYSITEFELMEKLKKLEKIEASRKEVQQIKNRLSEIGYFNYESIEKFNIISQELGFMKNQYEDLVKTRDDIIKMIKGIENEMKETFEITFQKIQTRFNEIFKILFNGGEAEVKLDGDDVLTAGVEIIARPPGKKLKTIGLLSGGEKALTAVALLFAIFEINPAPFCVLDEIDAALDEANIKRYITYLKTLVNQSQFIIITHRKTTMEMAEILYGVTMEEQGISKVITLMLND